MISPSTLLRSNPGGSEDRTCGRCGAWYQLPIPYPSCNPLTRDLCTECIHDLQMNHEISSGE